MFQQKHWCTPGDGTEPSLGQGGLSTSLNSCAGPCIVESRFVSGISSVEETKGTLWSQGGTGESRLAQTMGVSWGEFITESFKIVLEHLKFDELLIASLFT